MPGMDHAQAVAGAGKGVKQVVGMDAGQRIDCGDAVGEQGLDGRLAGGHVGRGGFGRFAALFGGLL